MIVCNILHWREPFGEYVNCNSIAPNKYFLITICCLCNKSGDIVISGYVVPESFKIFHICYSACCQIEKPFVVGPCFVMPEMEIVGHKSGEEKWNYCVNLFFS